jgi:apolipoprotein D and lipocalin family protein
MKIFLGFIACGLSLFTACSSTTTERLGLPELQTVQGFDLSRYLGTWYEIGSFPQSVQEGCTKTKAEYSLRDDGNVDIVNNCFKEGKEDIARGIARPVELDKGKLEVSFFQPFWGPYWVLELGADYDYAVVGHPSRDFLWILSRQPELSPTVFSGVQDLLRSVHQYELERYESTVQK